MQNIEKKIKKIIAQQLGLIEQKITNESLLVEDLNADSLDIVELIMAFEEEFNIEITDEEAENLTSVQSIFDIIKKYVF
ncbi:acyl carrier protein [Buchnera aphidicola str. Bp (Baizongia pistaciae)]|uniref:Acyl carrier protein n=1 Tax=Buchnera aphidicola subsp. Baizongia pistaciae (strain Bp) TaxID=224915 RepID=ACP_BUCBP|nr:acyl carrier protein [Buchnera aphidicola]P59449.1 RecName: Full=Acyl carrier protein; Short=ACP [Buchnera aphidicola str. Bp (Baizongia pistaciae)]AAO27044.1 acyl carrier protein [Buchnera aphidicola str. Bp (Baizongia pistaciae)]